MMPSLQFTEAAYFGSFQFQIAQKVVLILFKALQRKTGVQKYAVARGTNHYARCKYDADGRGFFYKPLQPIPCGRWNSAQLFLGIDGDIEQDQRRITVAQKQIGCFQSFRCRAATNPKEAGEDRFFELCDFEGIGAVNECDDLAGLRRLSKQ